MRCKDANSCVVIHCFGRWSARTRPTPPEGNISTNGVGIVSLIHLDLPCTRLLEPGVEERVEVKLLQSRMEEVASLEPVVVVVAVAVAVAAAVLVIVAGPVQRLESGLPPLKEMGATSQCSKSST